MSPLDIASAILVSVIWGLGFVIGIVGLQSFSPAQLTALRFIIVCVAVVVVRRPAVSWSSIVLIGSTLFTGQFLLLFFALTHGLPPGVASVSQQVQAFFTVLLAALFLGDVPTRRQGTGMAIAVIGLVLTGSTIGADLKLVGLGLGLGAAFSWAVGNVLVKRTPTDQMFRLVVWCSTVPPLPALVVSSLYDRRSALEAIRSASWLSIGAVLYSSVLATFVAYAIWGRLLRRYPAGLVAPFALLAPCTGVIASALLYGEIPGPLRFTGMLLILGGLAVSVAPTPWTWHLKTLRARVPARS